MRSAETEDVLLSRAGCRPVTHCQFSEAAEPLTQYVARGGLALVGWGMGKCGLGAMLIVFVSLVVHWLPAVGFVSLLDNPWLGLQTLILPALALGTAVAAFIMRMVRSSLLEVLRQD